MGYFLSKFKTSDESENYDVVDPATGLTPREVYLVKSTWEVVKSDIKRNGIDVFISLFDHHPEYQKLFKSFVNVPKDKLATNGRLLGHATSVMYAITSCVDNLNDPECLTEILIKIGESHVPRKIHSVHFTNLGIVIVELLQEKLGPKLMNEATTAAWKKTFVAINSIISPIVDKQ